MEKQKDNRTYSKLQVNKSETSAGDHHCWDVSLKRALMEIAGPILHCLALAPCLIAAALISDLAALCLFRKGSENNSAFYPLTLRRIFPPLLWPFFSLQLSLGSPESPVSSKLLPSVPIDTDTMPNGSIYKSEHKRMAWGIGDERNRRDNVDQRSTSVFERCSDLHLKTHKNKTRTNIFIWSEGCLTFGNALFWRHERFAINLQTVFDLRSWSRLKKASPLIGKRKEDHGDLSGCSRDVIDSDLKSQLQRQLRATQRPWGQGVLWGMERRRVLEREKRAHPHAFEYKRLENMTDTD